MKVIEQFPAQYIDICKNLGWPFIMNCSLNLVSVCEGNVKLSNVLAS